LWPAARTYSLAVQFYSFLHGPASAKWQSFVTMLFFGIKIPTTQHEIGAACNVAKGWIKDVDELHSCILTAWEWTNWISALLIRQPGNGARVFARVKAKGDTFEHKLSQ